MSESSHSELTPVRHVDVVVRKWADWLGPWQLVIGLLFGVIFGGVTMWFNIRSAARDAVTDEKFLGELAAKVRPSCVFNFQGAIMTEVGSAEYIGPINVRREGESVFVIQVKGKKHLNYPPLVECISYQMHTEEAVRTLGYDWEIKLAATVAFMTDSEVKGFQFKLEILH